MPKIVARFEIRYSRCLDPACELVAPLPPTACTSDQLIALYRAIVRTRSFDGKAIALQRTGRLGTFASSLGQEAVPVGATSAMRENDVLLPSFREHGAQLCRGVTPLELFLYCGGDERGSDFARAREDFPVCVPVGSHAPHGVGVALAFRLRNEKRAAVCIFGDGATSKGDVAEALNVAGVWKLPVIFVVSNNGWAVSMPRGRQSAAETLAQKAIAAGFTAEQVDGNDVAAVHGAVASALERAREGGGPHLIEALTYLLFDHTTADDASRYRDDAEVTRHWPEEPVLRLRRFLTALGHWTKTDEQRLFRETAVEMTAAADLYLATPPQDPAIMFDYTFASLPAELAAQRQAALGRIDFAASVGKTSNRTD